MTTSKPVRAWAVFTPQGNILTETIFCSRAGAQSRVSANWAKFEKIGYTVRRVTVQEEAK